MDTDSSFDCDAEHDGYRSVASFATSVHCKSCTEEEITTELQEERGVTKTCSKVSFCTLCFSVVSLIDRH